MIYDDKTIGEVNDKICEIRDLAFKAKSENLNEKHTQLNQILSRTTRSLS